MPQYAATEYDVLMKAIVIGDSGVGKSSLLHQYTEGDWNPTYIATIGVDFKIDTFETKGKIVKLQMWDTAGQERFKTICAAYYRGAHSIVLVFDMTDKESFDNIKFWMKEVETYGKIGVPMMLVGNKSDLPNRAVSPEEAKEFASRYNMDYVETSAKTANNVHFAFRKAVDTALEQRMEVMETESKKRKKYLTDIPEVRHQSCIQKFKSVLGL